MGMINTSKKLWVGGDSSMNISDTDALYMRADMM